MDDGPSGGQSVEADVTWATATDCVAVGYNDSMQGVIATTGDVGAHWTTRAVPSEVLLLFGVSCATVSICVAVGQGTLDGVLLGTSDGGSV